MITILALVVVGAIGSMVFPKLMRSHSIPIGKCQAVPLSFETESGQTVRAEWTTCLESVTLVPTAARVNVSWKAAIFHDTASMLRPSDHGNTKIYLVDEDGRRYFFHALGGAAATDTEFRSGDTFHGWYDFPIPSPIPSRMAFIDEDVGVKIWFTIR